MIWLELSVSSLFLSLPLSACVRTCTLAREIWERQTHAYTYPYVFRSWAVTLWSNTSNTICKWEVSVILFSLLRRLVFRFYCLLSSSSSSSFFLLFRSFWFGLWHPIKLFMSLVIIVALLLHVLFVCCELRWWWRRVTYMKKFNKKKQVFFPSRFFQINWRNFVWLHTIRQAWPAYLNDAVCHWIYCHAFEYACTNEVCVCVCVRVRTFF